MKTLPNFLWLFQMKCAKS